MGEPDSSLYYKKVNPITNVEVTYNSTVEKSYYDNNIKGKAIIFNHHKFVKNMAPPREGTAWDAFRLKKALERFNFDTDVCQNYKFNEIIAKMREVTQMKRSEISCLIVIVMTHGNKYGLVCASDKPYSVNKLWEILKPEKCKELIGIPKIFFIQACRGDESDKGSIATDDVEGPKEKHIKYPTMADFLQMYSSYEGIVSWRYPDGSWFIQSLCQTLETRGEEWHLLDMLTVVNNKVAFDFETPMGDKQVPQIVSMLTKFWKFKKVENWVDNKPSEV